MALTENAIAEPFGAVSMLVGMPVFGRRVVTREALHYRGSKSAPIRPPSELILLHDTDSYFANRRVPLSTPIHIKGAGFGKGEK